MTMVNGYRRGKRCSAGCEITKIRKSSGSSFVLSTVTGVSSTMWRLGQGSRMRRPRMLSAGNRVVGG